MHKVTFKIEGGEDVIIFAVGGETVLELAQNAGVLIDAPCAGNGTCGKCVVDILEDDVPVRYLACQVSIHSDTVVLISHRGTVLLCDSHGGIAQENRPPVRCPPVLSDIYSIFLEQQNESSTFGLAVDIGTTTVSAMLVGMVNPRIYAQKTVGNRQIIYGADVINRIIQQQKPGGIEKLQKAIIADTLLPLIDDLCVTAGISRDRIVKLTVAANTTMNHLLLGIDANSIRIEPYEPTFLEFEVRDPASIGIELAPGAEMLIAPNVGSYVGGDITAGILGAGPSTGWQLWMPSDMFKIDEFPPKMTLFIDLGTNGEIVLGNGEFLMACACSAGPAFEGGDISCGMRATEGAIEKCIIDKDTLLPELTVIGNSKPAGLCGSGIIDVVAQLFLAGIINGKGKFNNKNERIRYNEYGAGYYVLAFAEDSATGNDITITETDIDNFIRAKAAIFSGIISLLSPLGLTPADIDDVFIAGGIGSGINIKNAISIGMLPNLSEDKYKYLGNTALDGAYSMLLPMYSEQALEEVNDIARNMTYIDLSGQPDYMDEFIAACFLPHTDETLFPGRD